MCDAWLKTLDSDLPDAALTKSSLDLLGRGVSKWRVRDWWNEREKGGRTPTGRTRQNALRVLAYIEQSEEGNKRVYEDWTRALQTLEQSNDVDTLCLALLANVPQPGNFAAIAMDRLERVRDRGTIPYLRAALHVLTDVQYPGDYGPTKRLVAQLNRLIADLEPSAAKR